MNYKFIIMNSRTTITISKETKLVLEALKAVESWDEFLLGIIAEVQRIRREKSRGRLSELLEVEFEEVRVRKWAREY